jgi:rod shape determining protein RodA
VIVERRLSAHLDWPLIAAILALTFIGLMTIYSVTWDFRPGYDQPGREFWTQLYALPIGLIAMFACLMIDYRTLTQKSLILFGLFVAALVAVSLIGDVRMGARRWIALPGFSLQPSEFGRIVLALVLAGIYGEGRRGARTLWDLAVGAVVLGIPVLLILQQPDLGTAATLIPVYLGVVFINGLRLKWLAIAAVIAALMSPLVWAFVLEDYQKERIETFIDPSKDARGKGLQQIQAKVTVGSGGLVGKGFRQGTQGGYGFLPVAHNDFVYSVWAEEHGFLGVLVALGLYLFVLMRSFDAAKLAKDRVGACLVVGILSGFAFQVVYNITMSAGLAPVKGLTLPLMSYGGSSLVSTLAAFGLILNVRMRRFTN